MSKQKETPTEAPEEGRHWYNFSTEALMAELETRREGLTEFEAGNRLIKSGFNEIVFKNIPAWVRFLRQFNDPMVIILMITAAVTGVLTFFGSHMLPDTIVLAGVVLLNSMLGFVREGKAEGALDALRRMMVDEALVIRDGERQRIPARELVPGDIVTLGGGDKVPADVRFIEANNLHVDESSLTGESVPAKKSSEALTAENLVPGDQSNMGFSGTHVTLGSAIAVVTDTGRRTVFGKIADMVKKAESGLTPLQRKMKRFVRTLIFAILAIGSLNFIYGMYLGYEVSYSFLGAVSLVVAAIPEMLPALVTSVLALSGVVMAKRKALIRRLPAAETLGATSVICSDKTGTLTENRMTVTQVYAGHRLFHVEGTGYNVEGNFLHQGQVVDVQTDEALLRLLQTGFFCNNAQLGGDMSSAGEPTEVALKVSGAKGGLIVDGAHRYAEIPFDSSSKFMATITETREGRFLFVKGAPEVVAGMCNRILDMHGKEQPIHIEEVLSMADSFAQQALRTLGFAYLSLTKDQFDISRKHLENLCFVGLQGLIDPPREAAIDAVRVCKGAGIRTVMITGDHPSTAQAVAQQLGIEAERAMTGVELSELSEEELRSTVKDVSVFARVAPEHKKSIAEALKSHNQVVAMTGDGVNDAPALKAADIGVAMGQSGTEVAKEASDMVLADDNFSTIVGAVEEGRHAWNNLYKAILYTLPTNAAQALLIIGAVLLAVKVPLFSARFVLEPVQILWVNLLDSVLLTMPLMFEAKEKNLLSSPPRPAGTRIINALFLQRVVFMGLAIATPGFLIYYHFGSPAVVNGEIINAHLLTQAQTAAFWAILLAHFGYLVSARSVHRSAFLIAPFSNKWLLGGIVISILIRFIPTVVPGADALFRTASFPAEWWPLILACFLPSFIMIELDKLVRYLFKGKNGNNNSMV